MLEPPDLDLDEEEDLEREREDLEKHLIDLVKDLRFSLILVHNMTDSAKMQGHRLRMIQIFNF